MKHKSRKKIQGWIVFWPALTELVRLEYIFDALLAFTYSIILLLLMNRDFKYQKDSTHKSTMNLHHVLQDYRQTEQHKSTLSNKINII